MGSLLKKVAGFLPATFFYVDINRPLKFEISPIFIINVFRGESGAV
jgi:hypothetical protein